VLRVEEKSVTAKYAEGCLRVQATHCPARKEVHSTPHFFKIFTYITR
jgi:hypothetical protein